MQRFKVTLSTRNGNVEECRIQVRYRKGPLLQKSAGHNAELRTVKLKLTLTLVLTLTDTGGTVLTLMLGYRNLYIT